jgi:two-component system response regulator HydG
LVTVNCATLPEPLLESELFGRVRGAFTDAREGRVGSFEQASTGTLFFDEIGELPLSLQPKLLRVIQERLYKPVGSSSERTFAVRIIAATNRDLEQAVEDRLWREDLYYRICVLPVEVPPLRARGTDIVRLAEYFVDELAARDERPVHGIERDASDLLLSYDWPGNVRELRNCMERAVVLSDGPRVRIQDLPKKVVNHSESLVPNLSDATDAFLPLEEMEIRYIRQVLARCQGNKSAAAKLLRVTRKTLRHKLREEP